MSGSLQTDKWMRNLEAILLKGFAETSSKRDSLRDSLLVKWSREMFPNQQPAGRFDVHELDCWMRDSLKKILQARDERRDADQLDTPPPVEEASIELLTAEHSVGVAEKFSALQRSMEGDMDFIKAVMDTYTPVVREIVRQGFGRAVCEVMQVMRWVVMGVRGLMHGVRGVVQEQQKRALLEDEAGQTRQDVERLKAELGNAEEKIADLHEEVVMKDEDAKLLTPRPDFQDPVALSSECETTKEAVLALEDELSRLRKGLASMRRLTTGARRASEIAKEDSSENAATPTVNTDEESLAPAKRTVQVASPTKDSSATFDWSIAINAVKDDNIGEPQHVFTVLGIPLALMLRPSLAVSGWCLDAWGVSGCLWLVSCQCMERGELLTRVWGGNLALFDHLRTAQEEMVQKEELQRKEDVFLEMTSEKTKLSAEDFQAMQEALRQARAPAAGPAGGPPPGEGPLIPKFLRGKSSIKVKNKFVSKRDVEKVIKEVWKEKSRYDDDRVKNAKPFTELPTYLYTFLQKKYGVEAFVLEAGYNLLRSVHKYSYDADCEMFLKILTGEVHEDVLKDQMKLLTDLQLLFERTDSKKNGSMTGKLQLANVKSLIREFFYIRNDDDIDAMFKALAESQKDLFKEDWKSKIVNYKSLFEEDHNYDQGPFAECVRDQHLESRAKYLVEVKQAILSHSPEGEVSFRLAQDTIRSVDPSISDDILGQYVARGFNMSLKELKELEEEEVPVVANVDIFVSNLGSGVIYGRQAGRKAEGAGLNRSKAKMDPSPKNAYL
eukprot:gene4888-5970_t